MKNLMLIASVFIILAVAGCASQSDENISSPVNATSPSPASKLTEAASGTIDLAINNTTMRSADWAANYTVTVSPILRNLGDTVNNVEVGLYANDNLLKTFILNFSRGETKSPSYNWFPTESGRYEIKVIIDPANKIKDVNRQNNQFSYSVRIS